MGMNFRQENGISRRIFCLAHPISLFRGCHLAFFSWCLGRTGEELNRSYLNRHPLIGGWVRCLDSHTLSRLDYFIS